MSGNTPLWHRLWRWARPFVLVAIALYCCVSLWLWAEVLATHGRQGPAQHLANAISQASVQSHGVRAVLYRPIGVIVEYGRLGWRAGGRTLGLNDVNWDRLRFYQEENAQLPLPRAGIPRVVFFGDSLTAGWDLAGAFPGHDYVNRGIDGNTTIDMLARFRSDVLALQPQVVVIAGGINDLAGRWVPIPMVTTEDDYASMADLAQAHGIRVVMASLLPVGDHDGRLMSRRVVSADITRLNQWIRRFCEDRGLVYLDYYSQMADNRGAVKGGLTYDGLHPNDSGYATMAPLAEAAIVRALTSEESMAQPKISRLPSQQH